ncbi:LysE/ArgO family amino acid transporter [Neobacillus sp. MER 74]|uniref:LysE/ArgO family amino acid transporter n=1 Tax=Bacillaceae TaxID=186817 RepID=UPI000BF7029D|nr:MULTISPECIES: LysE/ArgO family amino acid transporter [Bacillaceae]MCM3116831.1 LysE/ArgO family amino acid transporter [Neobacillus sp. MER 74]PFP25766.1 lysine transporter LysE [Bacillus sp. AFS073361]
MISAAIHGFILAFGLILPLGVQNVFIFNQGAMQSRWIYVLPVVLTASICDTLLISLAVFGVSAVVLGITWIKMTLVLGGILFLLYMGYSTWKSKPKDEKITGDTFSPRKQIMFAASVSLLNPHAIMDTIGVIGTSSLSYSGSAKITFMVVCILVSWLWFIGLSIVGRLVGRIDSSGRFILILNKISALIMWGTAIYLMISF